MMTFATDDRCDARDVRRGGSNGRPSESRQAAAVASPWRCHLINLGWLAAGSLLVSVPLFYRALFVTHIGDHAQHVRFVQRGVETGVWPAHFLFQAMIYTFSGFSRDYVFLGWSALALLAACVVAKAWISYALLLRNCPRLPMIEHPHGLSQATFLALAVAALMLAAPIVRPWQTNRVYLGQISPNVWHNPTSIVSWPLVVLLFFAADSFLRSGHARTLVAVGLLAASSALAKPNYFLAFAPVYCLFAWWRFGISRAWLLSQAALIPTLTLLCWQWAAAFGGPDAMRPQLRIAWLPLAAWSIHSRSITLSLLFSLAFPLAYLTVFWRSLQHRRTLLFAWGVMLCALAWTSCFAEVGSRDGAVDTHFNFCWGSHLSLFVLFLSTAMDLFVNPAAMSVRGPGPASGHLAQLPWWLLGGHAASGVYWIVRQLCGYDFR